MSKTPIFDQMIAEYPLELRHSSHIFPVPSTQEFFRRKREESMEQHPAKGVVEGIVLPISGRVPRKVGGPQFMKPKPMVPKPSTQLIMGFDPATLEPVVVANVDDKGKVIWIQP